MKRCMFLMISLFSIFSCKQETRLSKNDIAVVSPENQMIYVWALNAILNKQNGASSFEFGGEKKNKDFQTEYREALAEWWDVSDKQTLLESIDLLKNGQMHQQVFQEEYKEFFTYDEAFYQYHLIHHPKTEKLDSILYENQSYFKEKGILAWDLIRAIGLVGWGYQADYLTKEEAYPICLEIGEKLQSNYSSYEDMVRSYCIGYFYWSGDFIDYKSRVKEAENILENQNSAWNVFPFDYNLEEKRL